MATLPNKKPSTHKTTLTILPAPVFPDASEVMRSLRNMKIAEVEGLKFRHADQLAMMKQPTLTEAQHQALLTYIQALRDVPQNSPDPTNPVWPVKPQGL